MALLWESLATRKANLLSASMRDRFHIHPGCAWINYVRCHDDIGWTFSDEDAAGLNINGYAHRRFLNDFYTGRFAGSFARGLPFQENPKTGDCRISGTCASLAGLEKALFEETAAEVSLAVRRILLIHSIIMTIGGVPLIYLGDEIGMLNDYSFRGDSAKEHDSRWVHRPIADPARYALRSQAGTPEEQIYSGLQRLTAARKANPVFGGGEMRVVDCGSPSVFAFLRSREGQRALVLANFSEEAQIIPANLLRLYGLSYQFTDLLTGNAVPSADLTLPAYEVVCLQGR
jgi:amylosucrase